MGLGGQETLQNMEKDQQHCQQCHLPHPTRMYLDVPQLIFLIVVSGQEEGLIPFCSSASFQIPEVQRTLNM